MAKAFWVIRPSAQDAQGTYSPSFPAGFQSYYQTLGDLRVFGPDAAPGDHKHAQIGPLAIGANHYHWMFWQQGGAGWYQEYVGPGGSSHTHTIPTGPTHFLVAVATTDAQYSAFIAAEPGALIVAQMPVSALGDGKFSAGDIANTAWDAPTRTTWATRVANFGLVLPVVVSNPRRFVRWLLASFEHTHQNIKDEKPYRMNSFAVQE